MCSKLSDHQLNIDSYMHKMLNMSLMVTTNQKPIIDTHTKNNNKKKESKYINKESHKTTR